MIPLVEAFGIEDNSMITAIGNSYGDIYESQLDWARKSRLNKESFLKHIQENMLPIMNGKL